MIGSLLLKLQAWCFLVLPITGFFIGQVIQFGLGTKHNRPFEGLIIHLVTVILSIILASDLLSASEKEDVQVRNPRDQLLFLMVSYLFILGVVLGIISVLY
jgi:hypothetical protein